MDDIQKILAKIFKESPKIKNNAKRLEVFEKWETIVGDKIARHAWPICHLEGGVLLIGTENSVWAQHLKYMEVQILSKINLEILSSGIKKLKFQVGGKPSV